MLENHKVKDIYVKIGDYPNISEDIPIGNAFHMMHNVLGDAHKYRSILVLDSGKRLKGYLSLRDLIRAVGPDYLHKKRPDVKGHQPFDFVGLNQDLSALSLLWQEGFSVEQLQSEAKKPVSEYMTLIEDQVKLDDPVAKALYLMLVKDILMIPVVEDGIVVGVIRLVDLFECLAENVKKVWGPGQE
ncbi:MAG: CBS domain-containing protein [Gammaproteobacteria bacterium]|nr:CBS domain-containing protein [Gammaproteobacteria bacterium]MDH5735672.1 CBS domain-containing protein [Gammaproteobacteria bacterium]